jgi:hypothetical protein
MHSSPIMVTRRITSTRFTPDGWYLLSAWEDTVSDTPQRWTFADECKRDGELSLICLSLSASVSRSRSLSMEVTDYEADDTGPIAFVELSPTPVIFQCAYFASLLLDASPFPVHASSTHVNLMVSTLLSSLSFGVTPPADCPSVCLSKQRQRNHTLGLFFFKVHVRNPRTACSLHRTH